MLDSYIARYRRSQDRQNPKFLDSIDVIDKCNETKLASQELSKRDASKRNDMGIESYWLSPEAHILFSVPQSESVIQTLVRREKIIFIQLVLMKKANQDHKM